MQACSPGGALIHSPALRRWDEGVGWESGRHTGTAARYPATHSTHGCVGLPAHAQQHAGNGCLSVAALWPLVRAARCAPRLVFRLAGPAWLKTGTISVHGLPAAGALGYEMKLEMVYTG